MTHVETPGRALTLEQYAGVTAALAEGIELQAVLAQERLDAEVWSASSFEWKARLVEDGPSGELFASYRQALAKAEDCLSRKVSPLDADPVAWVGFLMAYSKGTDAAELLRSLDLGPNDLARLARLWEGRARSDGEIRAKMAAAAAKDPAPLGGIRAEQRALRRFPWSPEPPAKKEPEPVAPPTPEPAVPDEPEVAAVSVQVPSFMSPGLRVGPMVPLAARPAEPPPGQKSLGSTAPNLVLPIKAPVPFQPGTAPPEIATSQGPPKAGNPLGETRTDFQVPKSLPLPFKKAEPAGSARHPLASTAVGAQLPIKRALPFEAGKPASQSPPVLSLEQHAALSLEVAVLPRHIDSILVRYRIDAATKAELDTRYRALLSESPKARAAWNQAYHAHYEKWQSRRKG